MASYAKMTITIDGIVREKEKNTIGMSDDKKEDKRDFKIQRRGRQRERQKNNRFN